MIIPFDCPHCHHEIRGERTDDGDCQAACPSCGKPSPVPRTGIAPGVVLGNGFRVVRKLGEGSLGTVYLGVQEGLDRQVRIELLSGMQAADEETFARFRREIKLCSGLLHPYLLNAIDTGVDLGNHFLVTQYKEGEALSEVLAQRGTLPEKEALAILQTVAEALAYAWDQSQLLHRNVRPETIVVTSAGIGLLADLGIAKSAAADSTTVTALGYAVGTPQYMSPEQARADDLDFRSDMYSLGIVLYQCLTGRLPFDDVSPIVVLQKQIDEAPVPVREVNPDVSAACAGLVDRMLAKSRSGRPATWHELIDQMEAVAEGRDPAPAAPSSPAPKVKAPVKRGGKPVKRPLTRLEVEQMAANMQVISPFTKFVLYALSAIIPFAIFGWYVWHSTHASSRGSDGQELVAPASPGQDGSSPATDAELQGMLDYAKGYLTSHPGDYEGAIRQMRTVREQVRGTRYFQMADEALDQLRKDERAAINEVMRSLNNQVGDLADQQQWDQAVALLDNYSGTLATETRDARAAALGILRERRRLESNEGKEQLAAIDSAVRTWRSRVAAALLGTFQMPPELLRQATTDPLLTEARQPVNDVMALVDEAARLPELVAASFEDQLGQTIQLELKGEKVQVIPKAVSGATITAEQLVTYEGGSGKMQIRIPADSLTLDEQLRRLQKTDSPRSSLLCGILAWRAGRRQQAAEFVGGAEGDLAQALADAMDR